LALDISANFLVALPPALESCFCLEELNVSFNPLRALPLFIAHLTSLRVLIADSTGITTLPAPLSALDRLHTLSIRRNKMYSLPSWLCLLVSLQTLLVDGNPFQGPWKALMEPLLAKGFSGSPYSPSTPILPPLHPTGRDTDSNTDTDADDTQLTQSDGRVQEDEDTITPIRAPVLGRSVTSPDPIGTTSTPPNHGVTRTRTTPNRAYYDKNRGGLNAPAGSSRAVSEHGNGLRKAPDSVYLNERDLRRMKSAGELRQVPPSILASGSPVSPGRLTRSQYVASASASNLLADAEPLPERFATIGPRSPSRGQGSRIPLDHSLWEKHSVSGSGPSTLPAQPQSTPSSSRVTSPLPQSVPIYDTEKSATRQRSVSRKKDDRSRDQQPGKWGFLKKMSMGKLRPDTPTHKALTIQVKPSMAPLTESTTSSSRSTPSEESRPPISLIDVRLSSTGSLGMDIPGATPEISVSPSIIEHKEVDIMEVPPPPSPFPAPSPSLLSVALSSPNLSPLSPTTRVTKRRSFLPIGGPPTPSSPLPSPGLFSGISLDSAEDDERRLLTPSPILSETVEQVQRREEERAREAYTRALRSVMAYLRDMNDLSVTQLGLMSMYSPSSPDMAGSGPRSRRPTTTDNGRVASDGTLSSLAASRSGSSDQLRSPESIAHLRSLNLSQTSSIATTDSGGSVNGEERKFKDDGGRRMKIVKEIVEYVKSISAPRCFLTAFSAEPNVRTLEGCKNSSTYTSSQQRPQ
jgi:hypothetical protein